MRAQRCTALVPLLDGSRASCIISRAASARACGGVISGGSSRAHRPLISWGVCVAQPCKGVCVSRVCSLLAAQQERGCVCQWTCVVGVVMCCDVAGGDCRGSLTVLPHTQTARQ